MRIRYLIYAAVVSALLSACAGDGGDYSSPSVRVGVGLHSGFYGHRPFGYYGRPPIIVAPGPDIDGPVATPLPEPGPDFDMGFPEADFMDF